MTTTSAPNPNTIVIPVPLALKVAATHASKDKSKPVLQSVHVKAAKGVITIVATDSYRMFIHETAVHEDDRDKTLSVTIPTEVIRDLPLKKSTRTAVLTYGGGETATISIDGRETTFAPVEADHGKTAYPDHRQLIPKNLTAGYTTTINARYAADAAKAIHTLTPDNPRMLTLCGVAQGMHPVIYTTGWIGETLCTRISVLIMPVRAGMANDGYGARPPIDDKPSKRISGLEDTVDALGAENDGLKEQIADLEGRIADLNGIIRALEDRKDAATLDLGHACKEISRLRRCVPALKAAVVRMHGRTAADPDGLYHAYDLAADDGDGAPVTIVRAYKDDAGDPADDAAPVDAPETPAAPMDDATPDADAAPAVVWHGETPAAPDSQIYTVWALVDGAVHLEARRYRNPRNAYAHGDAYAAAWLVRGAEVARHGVTRGHGDAAAAEILAAL